MIGRSAERAAVLRAIRRHRMVTVVGPGGVGKSELAMAVASAAAAGGDVTVVELSAASRSDTVVHAVGTALGVPANDENELAALLADRHGLLVLDGCDRCVAACRSVASAMLRHCPGMGILATASAPLGLGRQEHRFTLAPLGIPGEAVVSIDELVSFDAARLFVERARTAFPGLHIDKEGVRQVVEICTIVDGMPLALELVAAQLRVVGLAELAERLRQAAGDVDASCADMLPGERTMCSAVASAVGALDPQQLDVLGFLAVSAGSGVDAVVAGLGMADRQNTVQALASLVDLSLVVRRDRAGRARYVVLAVVAAAARRVLMEQGRLDELERRHAQWSAELLDGAEADLICGSRLRSRLAVLSDEEDNLRLALGRWLQWGDVARAAAMAVEMWRFWELRGRFAEGRQWLRSLLEKDPPAAMVGRLLDGLGMIAWRQGDHQAARAALAEALAYFEARGDRSGIARVSNHLGLVACFDGAYADAERWFDRALAGHRALGERGEAALVLANIGLLTADQGDLLRAQTAIDEALVIEQAEGDEHGLATARLHLGMVQVLAGCGPRAVDPLMTAATTFATLGDDRSLAYALVALGSALAADRPALSLSLAGTAAAVGEAVGVQLPATWAARAELVMAPAWDALGDEALTCFRGGRACAAPEALASAAAQLARPVDTRRHSGASSPGRRVRVRALGTFQVEVDGVPVALQPRAAHALRYLAAEGGVAHVEQLVEALWPEVDGLVGRRRLRNVVMRVNMASSHVGGEPPPAIVVRRGELVAFAEGVDLDVACFSEQARKASAALAAGDPAGRVMAHAALDMVRGELLADDPYDTWAVVPREQLRRRCVELWDALAADAGSRGASGELETYLRHGIAADPADEGRYVRLARLLVADGRVAAALGVVRDARAMAADLGIACSASVLELHRALQASAASDRSVP
ncbi:MAG: tetratricopeptide repeat protein [Actinomycetota bacterium]|nr:tetratricopeptide repeat protein [Actinomycetota bacterium]